MSNAILQSIVEAEEQAKKILEKAEVSCDNARKEAKKTCDGQRILASKESKESIAVIKSKYDFKFDQEEQLANQNTSKKISDIEMSVGSKEEKVYQALLATFISKYN